jgi:hypothetical protein
MSRNAGLNGSSRVTRRMLLARGAAAAGTAVTLGLLDATASAAVTDGRLPRWMRSSALPAGSPRGTLPLSAAIAVDPSQFAPVSQLSQALGAVDDLGLRATGSSVHQRYADGVAARFERAGLQNVTLEGVPLTRWQPSNWNLDIVGGIGAGSVPVANYVPYSGSTPAGGVTGPLTLISATAGFPGDIAPTAPAGSIGIVVVQGVPVPLLEFDEEDYGYPQQPVHPKGYDPLTLYDRAWLDQGNVEQALIAYKGKGLAGLVFVLDLPAVAAQGMYMPYHGIIYDTPAVFVDRNVGGQLITAALDGGHAHLTLEASVEQVSTPNIYGVIPGASEELVILESHTDGCNGLEENGCEALVAVAEYLARLPPCTLPRTVMVLAATGHFAGNALGVTTFCKRHKDDLIARTAAAVTIEHLGALEWLPSGVDDEYHLTGQYEFGAFFSAPFDAVIDPCRAALIQAEVTEDRVIKPFSSDTSSPDGEAWPGDGQPWWAISGLPSANFITGPVYLLNGGMRVFDFIDPDAFRRQTIAFTDLLLELGRTPLEQLQQRRSDDKVVSPSDTSPGTTATPLQCAAAPVAQARYVGRPTGRDVAFELSLSTGVLTGLTVELLKSGRAVASTHVRRLSITPERVTLRARHRIADGQYTLVLRQAHTVLLRTALHVTD